MTTAVVERDWLWAKLQWGVKECPALQACYPEVAVLAAFVQSGSPRLFVHPRSTNGDVRVNKAKLKLCGNQVDDVTMVINAFRGWQACAKRERHLWCADHCVDFSVMKEIERQMTHKPAAHIKVKSPEPGTSGQNSKLSRPALNLGLALLRCLPERLFLFSGHRKLGYVNVSTGMVCRVEVDSALNLRETFPEFVVDARQCKETDTSHKYLGLTVEVSHSDVLKFMADDTTMMDNLGKAKLKVVKSHLIPNLGFRTTQKMCKDKAALVGILARDTGCSRDLVKVDIEETTHEAKVFLPEEFHGNVLHTSVASYLWELRSEEAARVLHVPYPTSEAPVTVHIGAGGDILHISTPNDRTKPMLLFYNDSDNSKHSAPAISQFNESRLSKVMQEARLLDSVHPAERKQAGLFWGVANMRRMPVSQSVMDNVLRWEHGDQFLVVPLEDRLEVEYRLKFHWRRRQDVLYKPEIHYLDSYYYRRAKRTWRGRYHRSIQATFYDDRHLVKLRPRNREAKEADATADVRRAIDELTRGVSYREFEVTYAIQPTYHTSDKDLKRYRGQILEQLSNRVGDPLTAGDDYIYDVTIEHPADDDLRCYGYVLTTSSDLAFFLESHLITPFLIDDCPVRWNGGRAHALFTLSPEVLDVCWDALLKKKRQWQTQAGVEIVIKEMDTQVYVEVYVGSYDHDLLQDVSEDVLMVVASNTVVFLESPTEMQHALLTSTVYDVAAKSGTHVNISEENMEITVYGEEAVRTHAAEKIREALVQASRDKDRFMYLPLGKRTQLHITAMTLCNKFGNDLEALKQGSGCEEIHLDLCRGYLVCRGDPEALNKAKKEVFACIGELAPSAVNVEELECVACLCPVGTRSYQLEWCGHIYCSDCLQLQTQTSLKSVIFPVLCAADGCHMPLTVADMLYGNALADGKDENLAESSLKLFLPQNRQRYLTCSTADCRGIFPRTEEAEKFTCSQCKVSLCTACLTSPYHNGLSCRVHEAIGVVDPKVKEWIAHKPRVRKMCPRCLNGIEKNGGCNHVDCAVCHAQICWRCLRHFDTSFAVYQHSHEHRDLDSDDENEADNGNAGAGVDEMMAAMD